MECNSVLYASVIFRTIFIVGYFSPIPFVLLLLKGTACSFVEETHTCNLYIFNINELIIETMTE